MIIVVVTHHDFFDLAIFTHFAPEVLVERIEVVLQLGGIHLVLLIVCRVLVKVRKEDGLAVGWFDMFSRASITVSARANFVVERAIDLLLCQ